MSPQRAAIGCEVIPPPCEGEGVMIFDQRLKKIRILHLLAQQRLFQFGRRCNHPFAGPLQDEAAERRQIDLFTLPRTAYMHGSQQPSPCISI